MNKRLMRHTLACLAATASLSAALVSGAGAAAASGDQPPSSPVVHAGPSTGNVEPMAVHLTITAPERLAVGHCYQTPKACLLFQSDGNLVVYDENWVPRWNSGTWGYTGAYADFQTDGNLVVYTHSGIPLWESGTYRNPGATLWVQADGNVVIYKRNSTPIWDTGTYH